MDTKNSDPHSLKFVQQAFARWRRIRPHKRSRIPQELLKQAAAACEAERPTRVARQLGISYAVLKKQLDRKTNGDKKKINSTKQEFIKVDLKPTIPPALIIEVERTGREVIRFTFSGIGGSEINEIVKLFL